MRPMAIVSVNSLYKLRISPKISIVQRFQNGFKIIINISFGTGLSAHVLSPLNIQRRMHTYEIFSFCSCVHANSVCKKCVNSVCKK